MTDDPRSDPDRESTAETATDTDHEERAPLDFDPDEHRLFGVALPQSFGAEARHDYGLVLSPDDREATPVIPCERAELLALQDRLNRFFDRPTDDPTPKKGEHSVESPVTLTQEVDGETTSFGAHAGDELEFVYDRPASLAVEVADDLDRFASGGHDE
jgi:hypothetical protein